MFWAKRKKKSNGKPFGVQISIDINAMSLRDIARTSEPPSIEGMADVWLKYNCTRISVGIAAINGVNDSVLFFLGSDGCIYRDLDFEIKLPFPIGPNKTETVQVTPTEDFIFLSFDEMAIMALPTTYIINALLGEPLAEYRHAEKDRFGEKSEVDIKVTSDIGEYKLPVITKVAANWFKYENSAVKVMVTPILTNDVFPIELGISTE